MILDDFYLELVIILFISPKTRNQMIMILKYQILETEV